MKTLFTKNSPALMAGAAVAIAFATLGFAGTAQARDNLSISLSMGAPVGVYNAYPVYSQPVFVQQQPVYVQPAPVYIAPRPVYYGQPVYVQPQAVYYERPRGHGHHGGYYQQQPWGNRYGYAPVYYQRERGEGRRHGHDD